MKKISIIALLFFVYLTSAVAQENLLKNSAAESGSDYWKLFGEAKVENYTNNNSIFVVRNSGSFRQNIALPENSVGKYALLIGRGASERINPDKSITGLPYLYGYLIDNQKNGGRIKTYLTGQKLLGELYSASEWGKMYGIFKIPKETDSAVIFLKQAERKYDPQNGSAAKFDDIGFYIFETEKQALDFAENY